MTRFGSDPHAFFEAVYRDVAPWDVGDAQPALTALFDEIPPVGPALDVGCGSGHLAIALARRGVPVLGIDFVGAAIDEARRRAAALPDDVARHVAFDVADALRPSRLGRTFATVVDSGFLHLFDAAQRDAFADELAATLAPGGRYYVLGFAVTFPAPNVPSEVTEPELRARFTRERGWRILVCRQAELRSRAGTVPSTCACIERTAPDADG